MSSDSEECVVATPRSKVGQALAYSPIPERRALRKRKRASRSGLAVLEGSKPVVDLSATSSLPGSLTEEKTGAGTPIAPPDPSTAFKDALAQRPSGFAEDFFLGHAPAKLNRSLCANASSPAPLEASVNVDEPPYSERFPGWLQSMQHGYSLLLHGVGSKRKILMDFAEESLKPSGVVLVHMHIMDARFSLCEYFREVLEKAYPNALRRGTSAEALGAAIRAAAALPNARPLVIVAHNLEHAAHAHSVILSDLAASPGIHLAASIDSIWAPLAWDSRCLKDFNFCREEVNTFAGYEVEAAARHPRGLPPWSGLGQDKRRSPKASLSLVLRSLTNNHRELVQAMAERQLESESQAGISMPALLQISTDRMIAASVPKLKSLLNELRDHEVVVQRGYSNTVTAQSLFYLPFGESTLQKLQDGKALDSDEEGEDEWLRSTSGAAVDEEALL